MVPKAGRSQLEYANMSDVAKRKAIFTFVAEVTLEAWLSKNMGSWNVTPPGSMSVRLKLFQFWSRTLACVKDRCFFQALASGHDTTNAQHLASMFRTGIY